MYRDARLEGVRFETDYKSCFKFLLKIELLETLLKVLILCLYDEQLF
jgi:hypothetical protein